MARWRIHLLDLLLVPMSYDRQGSYCWKAYVRKITHTQLRGKFPHAFAHLVVAIPPLARVPEKWMPVFGTNAGKNMNSTGVH